MRSIHTRTGPWTRRARLLLLPLLVLGALVFATSAWGAGPTVASDKADYAPGDTVYLTGGGWQFLEQVHISVNDSAGTEWSHESFPDPVADPSGNVAYSFQLPTYFISNYTVTATGPISGVATTTFTDLNIGTYDQCSNDDGDGYGADPGTCGWINGNLQRNNSVYMEGDATVQRLWLTDLVPGSTHTVTLKYGTTKGGKHAYDFLTTWNWSEDWITTADRCAALSGTGTIPGCTDAAATEMTYPIPDDPSVTNTIEPVGGDGRLFTMAGGAITGASTPQIVSGDYTGDSETAITITYTVGDSAGSMCSTKGTTATCGIMLWFGAHVSVSGQWKLYNGTTGAGNISGSPYHVALDKVDGAAVGQRDNQMQAEVITYIPNGTIVLVKDAVPNDPQDFSFNLNNNSTIDFGTFHMDDDSDSTLTNTLSFDVPPGAWTAKELMPLPTGWSLTNLVCVDPTSNTTVDKATGTATIDLASLETVTCTYTDAKAGKVIVKKVTSGGDYSFEFDPSWGDNFFLSNGQSNDSGPLSAGTYSVAEVNVPSTWSLTSSTCDDGSKVDAISLQEGETVTCTFENTRVYNKDLTVKKTAVPSFTRTWDWTITKDADATYNLFAGQSVTHGYKVTVTPKSTDTAWKVDGKITVTNPNGFAISGVNVTDAIDNGGACTVTGGTNVTIPANDSKTLDYTCTWESMPTGDTGTNTAAVTWDKDAANTPTGAASGTAGVDFSTAIPTEVNPVVTVDDGNLTGESWSADRAKGEWTYTKDFSCSSDPAAYKDGKYSYSHPNTAKINETGQADSANVDVNCYAPVLSKVAAGTYDEIHDWDVTKTVKPASQSAFAGDTVSYEWTVIVDEKTTETNFKVAGDISIVNPAPMEMTVDLADALGGGQVAAIGTCTGGTYAAGKLAIPADTTATCPYAAFPGDRTDTVNKATATLNGIEFGASANVGWTANVIRGSATLDDDQNPGLPQTLTNGDTFTYAEQYTCSTDKTAYDAATHKYTFGGNNTATVTSGASSDSSKASTSVDCYVPTVDKTANGSYDEVHDWLVYKSGPGTVKRFAGQTAAWNWTVRVDETTHGENYLVTGGIVVENPNPEDAMKVSLSDMLADGSVASIGPCTGGTLVGNDLTVPAGGTANCGYSVTPKGDLAAFAAALPAQVTENLAYPGPESYFTTTLTNGGVLNGTYEGWCVDVDHTIYPNRNYTANVFSSYEALPAGLVEHPENFDLVNWIINYDFVGKPAGTGLGNYTYGDVQEAIWEEIEDVVPAGEISHNDTRVNQIKAMAAQHEGFTPTCGDYVAVVLQPVDGSQPITIGQVTFASLGVPCTDKNTVKAKLNELYFDATVDINWGPPNAVNPTATLDDSQNLAWPTTVSADQTFTYADPQGYTCPTDPTAYAGDGIAPVYTDPNTATLTYTGGSKTASATATVYCYGPILSKTAAAEWRKKYDWTITKTAAPASHTGFAGDTFTSAYDVFVDQTITDYGYKATGTIDVKNPSGSPGSMTVNVADMVSGGFAGTVDCDPATAGNQTSVVVSANTTKTCTYTASLPDNTSRVNTATGTFNSIGFPATANVVFGVPIIEGNPTINVTDNVQGALGSASEDKHFTYDRNFSCSKNAADYTNYADTDTYGNTATIDETGANDDASVTVNCSIPEISKTAAGTYDERHEWDVEKTVTPATQDAFAGGTVGYEWKVVVTEETFEENFVASGKITVVNHNPEDAMTVELSDVLSDSTAADITSCTGDADLTDGLTIAAGGTSVCDYTAAPVGRSAANNTATAVLNDVLYSASDPIEWTANVIRGSATVTDDQIGLNEAITDGDTFTGSDQYTCSTTESDYAGDGTTTFSEDNTAIITSGGGEEDRDNATETVKCYGPVVSKTAAGTYDERHEWDVEKTVNRTSQSGFAGDTVPFEWTITVDESMFEENFEVVGSVTVVNPAPMAMTVGLTDVLSDSTAVVIGSCSNGATYAGGNLTIPANTSTSCLYSADNLAFTDDAAAPNGNTATATLNGIPFVATYPIVWTPNVIRGEAELTDIQGPLSETITGSGSWTVKDSYTCSTEDTKYTDNYSYSETISNTAKVTSEDVERDSSTTSTAITCVKPEISKTAAGAYDERHEWDVTKTVSPVSQSAFAGDGVSYEWTVNVLESVVEENFVASGQITVVNHNTEDALIVALSDVLDGTTATITSCTGDADLADGLTIAKDSTSVCDYTAALDYDAVADAPTNNTATVVLNGKSYSASDPIEWTAKVIRGSVSLDDDQNPNLPSTISDGGSWKYSEQYTCSTDKTAYDATTHKYTFGESNTAVVKSGETTLDSSTASNTVDCYVPTISKDANGKYDEVHDWEVFKSVNTASQTAFAGEKKNFTWTVRVDETTHGESYVVDGKITVVNPNPEDVLTVALNDKLDDGSVATIGPCAGGTWSDPNLTVPGGGTATCDYSVTPKGDIEKLAAALPATVTINSINPGPDSYWLTTVSNDGALNGVYEAWCLDVDHTMNPGANYTAAVYSSYESYPGGLIEKSYDMDLVNWIINQGFVGHSAAPLAGNYTYGDVQRAIWEIIEDNPTATTAGLGAWNQARVDQIEALARANGQGFVPGCGDFVAVLLVPTGGQQPIGIAQVTFASLGLPCSENNQVKATLNGIEFPASAQILWTANKINDTATLDDDQKLDWPTTVSADTTVTYQDPQGYTCSTDPTKYTNGFYQYNESNTAVLTYETGSDTATASTAVKCYAPLVSKTAAGAYDERHEWDVEKTVSPTSQSAFAGDTVPYEWTVTVVESVFEESFVASGEISVKNPRPDDGNMTVKLTDVLSDNAAATIIGCTGGTWNAVNKTVAVPPNNTAVCSYTASLTYSDHAKAPTDNTVTAEVMVGATHLITTASDAVEWTADVIRGSATVDDNGNPGFPLDITEGGTWKYGEKYTCSNTRTDYDEASAWYHILKNNTATVTSGEKSDSSSSSTDVNCYWPANAKVVKVTTEGAEDIGKFPFTFELYNPSGTKVETKTLDGAGEVAFDAELKPEGTWKIVEVLPEGWVNTDASLECTFTVDYWADAGKTFTCTFNNTEMSRVKLLKWTQGVIDPTRSWTFSLWAGVDGFGGTKLGSSNTSGDQDGVLDFGNVNLSKYQAYTLCEESVPAGWTSFWQVDSNGDGVISDADAIINPYNPNASDSPPQDLGNRCVDIGAGTGNDLLSAGKSLLFMTNNTYPGGDPRTPGYWKNWNRVTGGGQAFNADRNGGYMEGFWLVEDVLNPNIGGGITWDDILVDDFKFPITEAAVAVDILDQRDIGDPALVGDGPKQSSDAGYTLAMHLLAAQLNFGAGARTCDAAFDAALAAEQLLDKYNFNGTGSYLRRGSDYSLALTLGKTLDQYNNGELCKGPAVSFVSPKDGDKITGDQTITIDAMDQVPVNKVEFFVDGVKIGEDTVKSDGWSILWDSTSVADGSRTLSAVATNSLNQSGSGDVTVTVDNVADPVLPTMHVGGLSATTTTAKAGKWNATATVTIHDASPAALSGAVVSLMWSDGITGTCTTAASGTCTVTRSNIASTVTSLTLDVTGVTLSGYVYDATLNELILPVTVTKP